MVQTELREERIQFIEAPSNEQRIIDDLMLVRAEYPRSVSADERERFHGFQDALSRFNLPGLTGLQSEAGEDVYDDRFKTGLVSLTMEAFGFDPYVPEPKIAQQAIKYLQIDLS